MKVTSLSNTEYNLFYETYIKKVPINIDLVEGFEKAEEEVSRFFIDIPSEKLEYRYQQDKWSIKEVFQHIIDTERIFMYRCFRIARQDKTLLAGFNQDEYILPSGAHSKSIQVLLKEYSLIRQNSIVLLKSLTKEDLMFIGNASGSNMSARAAAFMTLGHEIHHLEVIKKRYL